MPKESDSMRKVFGQVTLDVCVCNVKVFRTHMKIVKRTKFNKFANLYLRREIEIIRLTWQAKAQKND